MKKGFTLIELLAVIVILAIIALISTPIIIGLIDNAKKESFKNNSYGIIDSADGGIAKKLLNKEAPMLTKYEYIDGEETKVQGNIDITYNGKTPQNGILLINEIGQTAIFFYENGYCAMKMYDDTEIVLEKIEEEECLSEGTNYVYYDEIKGVNRPQLATGMTPIKWNGTTWVNTNTADAEWYNYSEKKWANAKTADGSFWVWIPRYVYRISSGWHGRDLAAGQGGTIDIQFTKGIDDDWNKDVISTIDLREVANASDAVNNGNKYTDHPSFTFGDTELTGFWIAKFEASGSPSAIDLKPNMTSYLNINISNSFTYSRNMETNSRYGWGTTGNNIDTHLIKNTEWGAVAYLSKSIYGKNAEVWINPSDNFTTGCAGDNASSNPTSGCLRTYDTNNGQQASTTGNIYGVYDMSGGSWEYTASYVNNGFATNTGSVLGADDKYKNVYEVGVTDSGVDNYAVTINHKGDAMYEISNGGVIENRGWYSDYSVMPATNSPTFGRGRAYGAGAGAGVFTIWCYTGGTHIVIGFRPTLVVGEGM